MMAKLGHVALHLTGSLSFAFAIYVDMFNTHVPDEISPTRAKFGGRWKYITFLNMVLQCIFFTVCLFSNFSGRFVRARDVMFASAAFPIGMFVALVFWSLWAIDRELIYPVRYDAFIPSWLNHLMHTTVVPLQLLQLTTTCHTYPSRREGGAITVTLFLAYLVWFNVIFYLGGFWVYPVFQVLSEVQRVIFMGFLTCFGGVLYFVGEKTNSLVWEKETKKD